MSFPTERINRSNSGAALNVPPWSSEEESIRKSCENLRLVTETNRPRSCSPSITFSDGCDKNVSKPSSGAIPKIKKNSSTNDKKSNIQVGLDRYVTVIKRKRSPTSSNVASSAKLPKNIASVKPNNENRFSILQNENDQPITASKSAKPPPIYLREKNSNALVQNLIKLIGENSFYVVPIKRGNIDETRIQVNGENDYRTVAKNFENQNRSFYTYQLKSSKGLQIILKGIDSNVEPSEIKESLAEKGFKPKHIFNIRNREKVPQPLFHVELEPGDIKLKKNETHPIYNLKYLLHRRITVEEPHKRSGPVQCMNCQEYGHTKAYCKLPSVCVACGELHNTSQCQKSREDASTKKCSNCGGNHTANYRGCPVYSNFKTLLSQKIKNPSAQAVNTVVSNINCPPLQQSFDGTATYAGALRNNQTQPQRPQPQEVNIIRSNLSCPQIQQSHANTASYAGVLRNRLGKPQGSQENLKKKQNPDVNEQTPIYNFSKLESTIETLVQTVNNFTHSMTAMMQDMMRMQSMLIQAVLKKP